MNVRAAIVLGFLVAAIGCKEDVPVPPPPVEPAEPVEEPEPVHPLLQIRQAFGLPIPPEVRYVRDNGSIIEVGTTLTVDEVEKFFRGRLVDYEFFRTSRHTLRIVGLRSTMPTIDVRYRAPKLPIAVQYSQQVRALREAELASKPPPKKLVKGDPVNVTIDGGVPLAPGAVYGEPYTPKPGDPLYQERYRPNFGKPFGSWVHN